MEPWLEQVDMTKGWLSLDEARLLHQSASQIAGGCIVEVGSYRGRSTIALATGAPDGVRVYAIEPHEEFVGPRGATFGPTDRKAWMRSMLRSGMWDRVRLVNLSSEVVTPGWDQPVGLLWIDGDHNYDAVRRDIDVWAPHLLPDAHVIFDDSVSPKDGPGRVVLELADSGAYEITERVGKVTKLRRLSA